VNRRRRTLTCIFLVPPIALGHLLLWVGWACLLRCRFRAAAGFGVAALAVSVACLLLFPLPGLESFPLPVRNAGIYAKLLSMAALTVAGAWGGCRVRQS
jgi:hypothetical protein